MVVDEGSISLLSPSWIIGGTEEEPSFVVNVKEEEEEGETDDAEGDGNKILVSSSPYDTVMMCIPMKHRITNHRYSKEDAMLMVVVSMECPRRSRG